MNKTNKPAILGGPPKFKKKVPLTVPSLVSWSKISKNIKEIIETGYLTKGRYLKAFEKKAAGYLGVPQAVAVSSCTTGLVITLQALELTGEVILPSFTFMATGHAVAWNRLKPVFVDVRPDTFNIDPVQVEKNITDKTSAILAPHIFGNPCDITALEKIARKHKLKLIFDAAHGFGALYQGRPLGANGQAEVFSLSPTKLLVAGEGGLVTTRDKKLAEKVKIGREYGNPGNYDSIYPGLNARMQEFSAILGAANLDILEKVALKRNRLARFFIKNLKDLPGLSFQTIEKGNRCSYKDLAIVVDERKAPLSRDRLARALACENIDTRNYYNPPLHRQTAYRKWGRALQLPVTEFLASSAVSLPISSKMTESEAALIARAIRNIWEFGRQIKKIKSS